MIEEQVFHFYKYGLSTSNLILKYLRRNIIIFTLLQVVFIVGLALFYFFIYRAPFPILSLLYVIQVFIGTYIFLNSPAKKVVQHKYGLPIDKRFFKHWANKEWQMFSLLVLSVFLSKKGISNKEKIDGLIDLLEKKEKLYTSNFKVLAGIFLVFTIPAWSAFNTWIFKFNSSLESAVQYLLSIMLLAFILDVFVGMLRFNIKDLYTSDKKHIFYLINLLESLSYIHQLSQDSDSFSGSNNVGSPTIKAKIVSKILEDYHKKYY
ncbi:hypothetical protein [Bacillus sp. OTU530]|uniref:hypothetical protein n=1 Tax=Bacillus sp. OTU530 TaxID=3043862 RepID=UPI00313B0361